MKIFKQEVKDGLSEAIAASSSIAYQSVIKQADKPSDEKLKLFTSKAYNPDQPDLAYIETILASTGWNLNDDIFVPSEMWKARYTAVDKKLNVEHDEDDIVGHITGSYVSSGQEVYYDEDIPDNFDIVTAAVIYKIWRKEETNNRIAKILKEIGEGLWFVSMECLFPKFDYGVITPEGASMIIERSEATSYLTKHLRIYGGSGEYEGHKIGRVLRDFTFSGKGLVSNPANPRSIILKSSASFVKPEQKQKFEIGERKMTEELLKEQLKLSQEKLDAALSELKSVKSDLEKAKADESQKREEAIKLSSEAKDKTISDLNTKIQEITEVLAKKDESIVSLNKEIADIKEALSAKDVELGKIAKANKDATRLQKLVDAGLEKTQAESSLEIYDSLSDENFDKVLETLKSVAKKDSKEDDKMKKDKAKYKDDMEDKKEGAKAGKETFSDTNAETSLGSNTGDDKGKLKVSLASWLSSTIGLKDNKGE